MRLALLFLIFPSIALADPALAAKKALYALEDTRASTGLTVGKQSMMALDELASPEYLLSPTMKQLISALRNAEPGKRMLIIGQELSTEGQTFLQAACDSVDVSAMYAMKLPALATKCHLAERHALPEHMAPTLEPGSLLLSAMIVDQFTRRHASEPELRLARWVSQYARSDETSKPISRP